MENRKILLYVLDGAWNTSEHAASIVLGVTEEIEPLQKKLAEIAESSAKEYIPKLWFGKNEDKGSRHYEVSDGDGNWAKFYITEHYVELSESLMGAISREMEKIDRTNDIKEHLRGLYESENLEPWKYEYINAKPEVIEEIRLMFDKYEDCNVSFNAVLENAADKVLRELVLDDEKLEFLWEQFGDVLVDDEECILDDFIGFECGTHREAVWQWFDKHHSKGVAALMFGGE